MSVSLKAAALEVAAMLRDRAEEPCYGHPVTQNPHDFTPDEESCSEAEIERHRRALEAWDRGEPIVTPGPWTAWPTEEAAQEHAHRCIASGADAASVHRDRERDCWTVHAHVGGWGIGTTVFRDEEMLRAAEVVEQLAASLPGDAE